MRRMLFRAGLAARGALLLFADMFVQVVPTRRTGGKRRVLIVRLDALGDFLLWMDAARALREIYPSEEWEMTLLGSPLWAEFARVQTDFDRIWTLNTRRFVWSLPYRGKMLTQVRRAKFDILVQARPTRELFVEDALTRASGAARRIGFMREWGPQTRIQKRISDRWYTEQVSAPDSLPELTRSAALVRALGFSQFRARVPSLRGQKPGDGSPYYVLVPGASWPGRRWPPERFAEIADRLHQQTGWQGVVCGGPEDTPLAKAILSASRTPIEDRTGQTTLTELSTLMRAAHLVISTETGGLHMAAVAGTPAVCILGGGHFGRFVPYKPEVPDNIRPLPLPVWTPMPCFGCDWQCIYPVEAEQPVPCIKSITTESVWRGVQDTLAAGNLTAISTEELQARA